MSTPTSIRIMKTMPANFRFEERGEWSGPFRTSIRYHNRKWFVWGLPMTVAGEGPFDSKEEAAQYANTKLEITTT